MNERLKSTETGLILIRPGIIHQLRRPNALDGAKTLGKPLIINVDQVGFLSHNNDGYVTFFMANGFEICLNIFYTEAEEILIAAKNGISKIIE